MIGSLLIQAELHGRADDGDVVVLFTPRPGDRDRSFTVIVHRWGRVSSGWTDLTVDSARAVLFDLRRSAVACAA